MKNRNRIWCAAIVLCLSSGLLIFAYFFNILPQKTYSAEEHGIKPLLSQVDFDGDGIDDYTDIMLGARADAKNKPRYDGTYYEGGYPPDDIGVCTDVVWRAFKNAGYDLKAMVDADITKNTASYKNITKPDPNIDFRRVKNLRVFFDSYAESLTLDIEEISEWQAGDIVIFGDDKHIGIISDKRNKAGHPFVIHNGGQPRREEDYLSRGRVTGHYRFDASLINEDILK